jgi:hypothetical protein
LTVPQLVPPADDFTIPAAPDRSLNEPPPEKPEASDDGVPAVDFYKELRTADRSQLNLVYKLVKAYCVPKVNRPPPSQVDFVISLTPIAGHLVSLPIFALFITDSSCF